MNKAQNLVIINHPLIQHKLTIMRKKDTSSAKFRTLLQEISLLMAYEITRDLPISYEQIETPLEPMLAPVLQNKDIVLISILRAGDGLIHGIWQLMPWAKVGYIGLYRDDQTLKPVEYYCKFPPLEDKVVIIVDPMLATGYSAAYAIKKVKNHLCKEIKYLCLLAAPQGIEVLTKEHPDCKVYTAAIDNHMNDHGYICPGLGDAGDRIFGTK